MRRRDDVQHLDEETLQALAGGGGDSAARAHLEGCERCTEAAHAYRALFAGLDALDDPMPDAAFTADVMARVDAAASLEPARASRAPWYGIAAALVALAGAVALWVGGGGSIAGMGSALGRGLTGLAKIQMVLSDIVHAVPPVAGAVMVLAQAAFLALVFFGLWRLLRPEIPQPVPEVS